MQKRLLSLFAVCLIGFLSLTDVTIAQTSQTNDTELTRQVTVLEVQQMNETELVQLISAKTRTHLINLLEGQSPEAKQKSLAILKKSIIDYLESK